MNILLITADQFRFDYMGFRSTVNVHTPNLDELAKNGAVHDHAYTVNPLCMPARCSLLTGLYSHQHGITNNCGDLNPLLPTMPQILQANNYQTAMIGKIHFYEGIPGNLDYVKCRDEVHKLGFDHVWLTSGKSMSEFTDDDWTYHLKEKGLLDAYRKDLIERNKGGLTHSSILDERDTVDYMTAEKAIDYINTYDNEKPFFMWLSFCNPHFPFDPDEEYHKKYKNAAFKEPIDFKCEPDSKQYDKWHRHAVAYAAMVEQLDSYVGKVIDVLKKQNLYDETLIVFTADHGEMLADHNHYSKCFPHDGSIRVPFIAVNKDLVVPGLYDQATEITDVAATFLEVAGVKDIQANLPESPSQSLLGLWQGQGLQREYAFTESGYQFEVPFMSLCNGLWKYVFYSFTGEELLFDLANDPGETSNISEKYPELTSEFRKLMLGRLGATPMPSPAFWVKEKTTGIKSPNWHHGPQYKNTAIMKLK